jgi:hypothetical protein
MGGDERSDEQRTTPASGVEHVDREGLMLFALSIAFTALAAGLATGGFIASVVRHKHVAIVSPRH